jgi:hypothetical protein
MITKSFQYADWWVEYTPEDGARLNKLCFKNIDLLTTAPTNFKRPKKDYGSYENRPVYGYDDCFPSVTECNYPGKNWIVPDHGEVCWLPWNVSEGTNSIKFEVRSKEIPLLLRRTLKFSEDKLTWDFTVINVGDLKYPFQHVIHPLQPLDSISSIKLPSFSRVINEKGCEMREISSPSSIEDLLINLPKGQAKMFFLQEVTDGSLKLEFKEKVNLEMVFPTNLFTTIGIWWNNNGYPNEDGIRRNECAFEPIAGFNSCLLDAFLQKSCHFVSPGEEVNWRIDWKINQIK